MASVEGLQATEARIKAEVSISSEQRVLKASPSSHRNVLIMDMRDKTRRSQPDELLSASQGV